MALSNIFREPQRELIEQAYGLCGMLGFVALDVGIALIICRIFDGTVHVPVLVFLFSVFMAVFVIVVGFALIYIMHEIGEGICNSMARRGYDPRPQRRWH